MERSDRIHDQRSDFDRTLLIELQESLERLGLRVIDLANARVASLEETQTWTAIAGKPEFDKVLTEESMNALRLASRVRDDEVRRVVDQYLDAIRDALHADTTDEVFDSLDRCTTLFHELIDRTGMVLRDT